MSSYSVLLLIAKSISIVSGTQTQQKLKLNCVITEAFLAVVAVSTHFRSFVDKSGATKRNLLIGKPQYLSVTEE